MGNRWGNSGNSVRLFFRTPKSLQMETAAMKFKDAYSLERKLRPAPAPHATRDPPPATLPQNSVCTLPAKPSSLTLLGNS